MSAPTRPGDRRTGWRWRRNPLRRPCDTVEAWARLVLLTVVFLWVPLAGALCGAATYDAAATEAARQRAALHVVRATVVRSDPAPTAAYGSGQTRHPVTVRWRGPDGAQRVAVVRTRTDTPVGSRTDVWLDAAERAVTGPPSGVELGTAAVAVGSVTAIGGWLTAAGLWCAVRASAHRRRLAEWERDWARTEPRWSGRA
ncbi:hypothetical protein ACFYVL_34100 [Streptomyces sp. NPDC004111]|uniref:Rv1733c family protein n=1 Tax=Streptomyces sp. NPDC004111 TaxID=3364690 RepID=UPI0036A8A2CA